MFVYVGACVTNQCPVWNSISKGALNASWPSKETPISCDWGLVKPSHLFLTAFGT